MLEVVKLPQAIRDEIVAHARAEYPRECCGVISGSGGIAGTLSRITNTESGNRLYSMDDQELFQTLKQIDEREEDVFIIYHSHPESEAYPSKTDVSLAFYPDSWYLICSLENRDDPSLRIFSIRNEVITEAALQLS